MTLATKRVHNLPPHLIYVSTLPDITQKNRNMTLTNRSTDTWDRIHHGIIDKAIDQWQTPLRACVKAKGRHFEHLL